MYKNDEKENKFEQKTASSAKQPKCRYDFISELSVT